MMKNPWPAVVVTVTLLLCVTFLAYIRADTSVLVGLAAAAVLPVVTMIYGSVEQTRAQTNGNNTQMTELLREVTRYLAASPPVTLPPTDTPQEESP